MVGDGFDVEAKGRTNDTSVLPINLQNDCSFSRIVQPTAYKSQLLINVVKSRAKKKELEAKLTP